MSSFLENQRLFSKLDKFIFNYIIKKSIFKFFYCKQHALFSFYIIIKISTFI